MKKMLIGLIIGMIITGSIPIFGKIKFDNTKVSSVGDIWTIFHEGEILDMDDPESEENYQVLNYNGRTYVPLRLIAETAGYDSETM